MDFGYQVLDFQQKHSSFLVEFTPTDETLTARILGIRVPSILIKTNNEAAIRKEIIKHAPLHEWLEERDQVAVGEGFDDMMDALAIPVLAKTEPIEPVFDPDEVAVNYEADTVYNAATGRYVYQLRNLTAAEKNEAKERRKVRVFRAAQHYIFSQYSSDMIVLTEELAKGNNVQAKANKKWLNNIRKEQYKRMKDVDKDLWEESLLDFSSFGGVPYSLDTLADTAGW